MTFNQTTSYNRTYEKKVIEETPRVRVAAMPADFAHVRAPTAFQHLIPSLGGFSLSDNFGGGVSSIQQSDNSLHAVVDVRNFQPEDLKVSVIGTSIVVEGAHAEKSDDFGTIERHFIRKFTLPPKVEPEAVTSSLTNEGQLTIVALPPRKEASPARVIPVKVVSTAPTAPPPADAPKAE